MKRFEKQFSKSLPDVGINSVNSKMKEMFNGVGQYHEKALILMNNFLPITLKLENHKVFFTDKIEL